jgi:RecJ-like exonuclease
LVETKPLLLAFASLIGIFVIGFIGEQMELELTDLNEIDSDMVNQVVHVRGIIKEYKPFSKGVTLLIEQDGYRMTAVYFGGITGKKGMCADIVGDVETESGAVEISASELNIFIC